MNFRDEIVEERALKDEPQFLMQPCDCGGPTCQSVVFAMLRPVIRTTEDGELASVVHFPLEYAQDFVDRLRALARERGVRIK